jgi:hypothetical protein
MDAIKELWHGNIIPQEDSRTNSKEMKELLGYMAKHHEELEKLYKNREFAFGLRYVVQHGVPDRSTKEALYRFTETPEKILHHFSDGRLCSLVENIASTKY